MVRINPGRPQKDCVSAKVNHGKIIREDDKGTALLADSPVF